MGQGFFFVFYDPFGRDFMTHLVLPWYPKLWPRVEQRKWILAKQLKKNNQKPNHQKKTTRQEESPEKSRKKQEKTRKTQKHAKKKNKKQKNKLKKTKK